MSLNNENSYLHMLKTLVDRQAGLFYRCSKIAEYKKEKKYEV